MKLSIRFLNLATAINLYPSMFKTSICLFFLLLCFSLSSSKPMDVDSLKLEYRALPPDSAGSLTEMQTLYRLGILTQKSNLDTCMMYLRKYHSLAFQRHDVDNIVMGYRKLGYCYRILGDAERELKHFQLAFATLKVRNLEDKYAPVLGDIAGSYYEAEFYEVAKRYYEEQIKLCKKYQPEIYLFGSLSNLGWACVGIADRDRTYYDSARKYFNLALEEGRMMENRFLDGVAMDYLGETELKAGNLEAGELHFRAELEYLDEIPSPDPYESSRRVFRGRANFGLAKLYNELEEPDSVLKFADEALRVWSELDFDYQDRKASKTKMLKALAHEMKGNRHLAEVFVKKSLSQADSIPDNVDLMSELYFSASNFHYRNGDYKQAWDAMEKYEKLEAQKRDESDKWAYFSSHADLMNSVIELELAKEQSYSRQARKIRNISIGTAIIIAFFFLLTLFLFKNLRKSLRQNKENAKQLALLNETKDKLMSVLAHDLRSPFNSIMGLSKQVQRRIESQSWEEARSSAQVIEESSREAFLLFENLLGWAKAQTGKLPFQAESIDLSVLIHETVGVLQGMAKNHKVSIVVDVDHPWSTGDPNMLLAVFRNLVSNALKHTPEGKSVKISVQNCQSHLKLTVADEGPGLEAADIEAFNQGTAGKGKRGLGLILVREFVEAHGQHIHVESRAGEGACFTFNLPIRAAQVKAAPEKTVWYALQERPIQLEVPPQWSVEYEELIPKLKRLKIYQISKAKRLLEEVRPIESPDWKNWKAKFFQALDEFDEKEFSRLIASLH